MTITRLSIKNALSSVFLFIFFFTLSAQTAFTTEQYREDLRFLQKTVHKDFSFLFKKTTAEAFDAEVEKLYEQIPQMQPHEVLVGYCRLVASFEYGHTILGYWENIIPLHQLPIVLYDFDDGIFIQGIRKEYKKALGAKVLAIEGVPINEVLKLMRPVIPAENEQFVKAYGIHYLNFPEFLHAQGVLKTMSNSIVFTLEKDGQTFEQRLETTPFERPPKAIRHGGTGW